MGVRLPAEYQEVEYITGNRTNQYINTGISSTSDELVIEAKVKPGAYMVYAALWGNYIDESHKVTRLIASNSPNAILSFINTVAGNGTNQITKTLFGQNTVFVIRQEKRKITINGISNTTVVAGGGTANDTPIAINAAKINPTPAASDYPQSFYYFRILDGETVLIDLVPCYRKSDDKPGMYDLVSDTFFTNAGTGEFAVGPDVIDSISPLMVAWRRIMMAAASVAKKLTKLIATSTTGLVSFDTNVEMPTKVTCEFNPVQAEGTPSPDNPLPISGYTGANITTAGANIYNFGKSTQTVNGVLFTKNSDGSYTATNTAEGGNADLVGNSVTLKPGVYTCRTYIANQVNNINASLYVNNAWKGYTSNTNGVRIELEKKASVNITLFVRNGTNANGARFYSQITPGYPAAAYEPYQGETTLPINWQTEAGTIYGGTLTLNEDGSADVVSTHGLAEITSATPKGSFATNANGRGRAGYNVSSLGIPSAENRVTAQKLKTNALAPQSSTNIFNYGSAYSVGFNANGDIVFITLSAAENTVALFNEYLDTIGTVQLWYPLATPITYHFDNIGQLETLLGTNNIWHNMNGDITVEYWEKQ